MCNSFLRLIYLLCFNMDFCIFYHVSTQVIAAHIYLYNVTLMMTLTPLIFDLEATNLVISRQITIGLSLNFAHMYKFMNEDNRIFTGWIFVLAPAGASTPLVFIILFFVEQLFCRTDSQSLLNISMQFFCEVISVLTKLIQFTFSYPWHYEKNHNVLLGHALQFCRYFQYY